MNIYSLPVLMSAILCTLLTVINWLLRRRKQINRSFSIFTLALALDSFVYFLWFQHGTVENMITWTRLTISIGFIVPASLLIFFIAFTGYDKRLDDKVFGLKVRHFRTIVLFSIVVTVFFSQFSNLMIVIPENPQDIWDFEFGIIGQIMFPMYAVIFIYLYTLAYRGFRTFANKARKRFILLLSLGMGAWILFGYGGAALIPVTSELWQAFSYSGTAIMAVFFFVAIVNFQSDQVHELNLNLEQKVKDRTRELKLKNTELEDTLTKLKRMQNQVIVQEKMVTLGRLVAGLTHEINTPMSAIQSMNDTRSKALSKLKKALWKQRSDGEEKDLEIRKAMEMMENADQLIDQGSDRLNELIESLRNFVRLDEAEQKQVDIHEGIDSALALIKHDKLTDIEVVREFCDLPPILCRPRELNQVFLNLLLNAVTRIEGQGRITITTNTKGRHASIAFQDTGKGYRQDELNSIFDPVFTTDGPAVRTSLALSVSYKIVQEHGGNIEVESIPGQGSEFKVILPIDV